jgi:hypothetical protein
LVGIIEHMHVELFLSAVTNEFRDCRNSLSTLLKRPNVDVQVQEDFIPTGTETLDKLDSYIARCHAVVHIARDMTGAWAGPAALQNCASAMLTWAIDYRRSSDRWNPATRRSGIHNGKPIWRSITASPW